MAPETAWIRARRPSRKAIRRASMLSSALSLYLEMGYEQTHMVDIADGAGVSKGNLYRYFESKEALFLELLLEQLETWSDELTDRLALPGRMGFASAVASEISRSLCARPPLLELLALRSPVLEPRVHRDTLNRFRDRFGRALDAVSGQLVLSLPEIPPALAERLPLWTTALAAGLWSHRYAMPGDGSRPPARLQSELTRAVQAWFVGGLPAGS